MAEDIIQQQQDDVQGQASPVEDAERLDEMIMERLPRQELHTQGLVKRYGRRTVADHVSFNVKQGEIVGLLGPMARARPRPFT